MFIQLLLLGIYYSDNQITLAIWHKKINKIRLFAFKFNKTRKSTKYRIEQLQIYWHNTNFQDVTSSACDSVNIQQHHRSKVTHSAVIGNAQFMEK